MVADATEMPPAEVYATGSYIAESHTERSGSLCQTAGAARQAEELRRENEQLRARVAALMRWNADLEQFAWSASHDLKEPLRTLSAYTNLLLRRRPAEPDSEEAAFAGFIQSGIERLQDMIDGLGAYARAGKGEDQPYVCDTTEIAGDAVEALQALMAERSASATLAPLPNVIAAPLPVLQIFTNLIGNALKYCEPGVAPRIEIFADEEVDADPPPSGRPMVRFGVRDHGIGIDPQYAERIFHPFQRLHGEEYPGVGLGLALAKRLVERYGGRIWVECNPGGGCTFYFTLPLAQAAPSNAMGAAGTL